MTAPTTPPRRASNAVAVLVLVWLLALPAVAAWMFAIGIQGWADQHSGTDRSAELERSSTLAVLALAVVLCGVPALIATVAFAGRMRRTGVVFTVLAAAGTVLALVVAGETFRTVGPPPPPPSVPGACQEHSGGDTRCPGG